MSQSDEINVAVNASVAVENIPSVRDTLYAENVTTPVIHVAGRAKVSKEGRVPQRRKTFFETCR